MEELIYSIDWAQVKTAFDIFMWGDPNSHVIKAGNMTPQAWIALGSAVISATTAGVSAIKANKRRKQWLKRYNSRMAELDAQEITNPYENLVNPYEDITVNQQQAKFQSQQQQQGLATAMRSLRPVAGASGAAGLAQAIANQQTRNQQQISANIGLQEAANQKIIAGGQMSIQMAERQGEDMVQARRQQIALAKAGMAQAGFTNAQARADQAVGNLGYAVGSGLGEVSSALEQAQLSKEMDALKAQLGGQTTTTNEPIGRKEFKEDYDFSIPGTRKKFRQDWRTYKDSLSSVGTYADPLSQTQNLTNLTTKVVPDLPMVTIDPNLNLAFRTPGSHTVMGGENVISIARKYNMSPEDIKRINELVGDNPVIRPGQKLNLMG